MFCKQCGTNQRDGAKFCAQCGAPLSVPAATTPAPPSPDAIPSEAPLDAWSETLPPDAPPDDLAEQTPENAAPARSPALWFGLAALVLVIVLAGLWLFKQPASEMAEAELPAAEAPAAPPEEAPPAVTEEETTASLAEQVATEAPPDPAPTRSLLEMITAPADRPAAEAPVIFDEAAAKDLVARLQTESQPASCRAGIAKLRQDNHLTANQARNIAKRTWPELCPPPKPIPPPPEIIEPEPPAPVIKSIDQVYQERSASECAAGLPGFFCREDLRYKLCAGKWTSQPPAGQSLCYLADENR